MTPMGAEHDLVAGTISRLHVLGLVLDRNEHRQRAPGH